jgi:hypothetical protein
MGLRPAQDSLEQADGETGDTDARPAMTCT